MSPMNDNDPILFYEAELRQAQLNGDVDALDRLLDDTLVFTALDGTVVGKEDDLNLHRSGSFRIIRMDPIDHHIVNIGNVVVVNSGMEAEAIINGEPVSNRLRYTRVWCKGPDGWRVIAGHMSTIQS